MVTLESFGLTTLAKKSESVHQARNLLSLELNLCSMFDSNYLNLWLERTRKMCTFRDLVSHPDWPRVQPNRYKVCMFHESDKGYIRCNFVGPKPHVDRAPMVVEFTSRCEEAPPPDLQLFTFYTTCVRFTRISGANEFFDK